jgi:ferric-dicitrate binding protein FerR (iron transport regulator)
MRQIYTSPRQQNIERVVALMAENGIATTVTNKRAYVRPSYSRFSYSQANDSEEWPKVWITHAADQTRARQLLREIGIEPATRYVDALAAARDPTLPDPERHRRAASRVRTAAMTALGAAFLLLVLKMLAVF